MMSAGDSIDHEDTVLSFVPPLTNSQLPAPPRTSGIGYNGRNNGVRQGVNHQRFVSNSVMTGPVAITGHSHETQMTSNRVAELSLFGADQARGGNANVRYPPIDTQEVIRR